MHVRHAKAFACLLVLLATARAEAADPGRVVYPRACEPVSQAEFDRAHTLFLSGKQFLDESNYDKAISYFVDSYTVNCNLHEILISIATVFERKGDKAESIRALEEYLVRAPQAHEREKIERRIQNLKEQLPSAAAPPAQQPEAPSALTPAHPTPGAGEPHESGEDRGKASVAPWILVIGGGAAAIAGAAIVGISVADYNSVAGRCPNGQCLASTNPNAASDTSKANGDRTVAAIGEVVAGVGVAAVASGVLYWALTPSHRESHPRHVSFAPILSPTVKGAAATFEF